MANAEKNSNSDRNLSEEVYQLKKEKEQLILVHRN